MRATATARTAAKPIHSGEKARVSRPCPKWRAPFPGANSSRATDYVRTHRDRYRDLRWREIPRYRGVEVNSLFDPNYDILVDT